MRVLSIGAAVLAASIDEAQAYIDPGTGTMLLQLIGAAIAGAMFYFRTLRRMITDWLSGLRKRPDAQD